MTTTEILKYRALLEQRAAELAERLRARSEIAIESAPDIMDGVIMATQREAAVWNLNRASRLMAEIRKALQRMESGDFGVCGQCEGVISRKRLEALPWAALCITCQEQLDSIAGRRGGVEEQVA